VASDGVKIIGSSEIEDGDFLYFLLEKYMPYSEGYKRHYSILKEQEVKITINKNEQKKLGDYFKNLDNLITLHQREREKLENIKKSCLEKMFV